jgi:DNA polymerase-1
VQDIGPLDAKIMLVGEAPGAQEEEQGIPFVGKAGGMLKAMLYEAGIDFSKCYVTNVVDSRPPHNDFSIFYEDKKRTKAKEELLKYQQDLREKILRLRPNIVILLGKEALRAVLNKPGITEWRGSICLFHDIKCLPTFHPASILRMYENRVIAEMDLRKAFKESSYPEYYDPTDNLSLELMPTFGRTLLFLTELLEKKPERISFDLETTYETQMIRLCGIAYRDGKETKAISIPFSASVSRKNSTDLSKNIVAFPKGTGYTSYFSTTQEIAVLDLLARIFKDPEIKKVGQNSVAFDQPILEKQFGMRFCNHYMDTMHAHHLCYLEFPKSLNFMTTMYTDYGNYWSEKIVEDDLSYSKYNAMDCVVTLDCSYALDSELKELEMYDFFHEHIMPLAFVTARMSEHGILFNVAEGKKLSEEYQAEMDEITKRVSAIAGREINIDSPLQLKELLYEKQKFPKQFNKGGSLTTDAEALKKLVQKYPESKVLQEILRYRKISKLVGTYLTPKLDADGVMRTSFDVSGTDTGRLSSSSTARGTGGNLQNIPEGIRYLYHTPKGTVLVKFDLSQAEALAVAELLAKHGDRTLVERYEDPTFDIHVWGAEGIFECKREDVGEEERDVGKLGNHSGNYGAGPQVLVSRSIKQELKYKGGVGIPLRMARKILEKRHKMIPGLKIWWRAVEKELRDSRMLKTCFGRKRFFFGRLDETTYRSAYAFEPQSTVGDLTNAILIKIERLLPKDVHIVLQVHDEGDFEVPLDKVDEVVSLIKECSKIPLQLCPGRPPLIIPVEIKVGETWGTMKEYVENGKET